MDEKQILDIVHQTAAEIMATQEGAAAEHGTGGNAGGADNLAEGYGLSSIDALKFLLVLEEKFGVTFADQDLNGDVLSSATALAKRIGALRPT